MKSSRSSVRSRQEMLMAAVVTCAVLFTMLALGVARANAEDSSPASSCVEPAFTQTFDPEFTRLAQRTPQQIEQWRTEIRGLQTLDGEYRTGEILIKFSESSSPEQRCAVKARLGLQFLGFVMYRADLQAVRSPANTNDQLLAVLKQLTYEPDVENAEGNAITHVGTRSPSPMPGFAAPDIVGSVTAQRQSVQTTSKRCKGKKARARGCKAAKKRAASRRR